MARIIPTVGRIILYWPNKEERASQPYAAIVAHVWGEDCVNLGVFTPNGVPFAATSVPIVQEGSPFTAGDSPYAEWMVYQKDQAAKHEAKPAT